MRTFRNTLQDLEKNMTRILLVDDHTIFRQAIAYLLTHEPDLEVVAEAGSLAEAGRSLLPLGAWTLRYST